MDHAPITCRVHDECSGSDVFGSDLCTCRPYLAFSVEEAIRSAQAGGLGIVVYNRKEGRALGEVVKLLVYNARARHEAGDRPDAYFSQTEKVAGVRDLRFQSLSTDVLHWLGVKRIERWISMSNMKSAALADAGIDVVHQIALPDARIPEHADVEISAKRAAGYFVGAA
jgi:GTP cyclohydrolase II